MKCPKCGGFKLEYEGHVAAPGFGQHWKCGDCERVFLKVGGEVHDLADLSAEDVVLDPSDCI